MSNEEFFVKICDLIDNAQINEVEKRRLLDWVKKSVDVNQESKKTSENGKQKIFGYPPSTSIYQCK